MAEPQETPQEASNDSMMLRATNYGHMMALTSHPSSGEWMAVVLSQQTQSPGFDAQNHGILRVHMLAVRGHTDSRVLFPPHPQFSFWVTFPTCPTPPPVTYLLHQSRSYWLPPPPPLQVAAAGGQGPPGNRGLQYEELRGSPLRVLSSPPGMGRQPLDSQSHLEEPLWEHKTGKRRSTFWRKLPGCRFPDYTQNQGSWSLHVTAKPQE